jgi:hypothetical protein
VDVGGNSSGQSLFVIAPVLDSVFVADTLPARDVYVLDGNGQRQSPGPFAWRISPTSVATVDSTGKIVGQSKGTAIVIAARPDSVKSGAVIIVSRPLELTPLLDTIYLMPGDTITVPVAIKERTPGTPTLQFDLSPDASVYTVDDATTGLITAHAVGGPVRYRASVTDGPNTVSDSGAVIVMSLTDTSDDGRFYMTAFGTAIRHQGGTAFGLNYQKANGRSAFELVDTLNTGTLSERLFVTLVDSLTAAGRFEIDSISPVEATTRIFSQDPICSPKRPWAVWASTPNDPTFAGIVGYSHGTATSIVAGELSITQYESAPVGGGAIIAGRYFFRAQRVDLYGDPLGVETIRGTFVAPLRVRNICTA